MAHRPKTWLDQGRDAIRLKHDSMRTEASSGTWMKRDMLSHHQRHPHERASADIEAFLTHLAVPQQGAASTQHQALSAWLFLSRDVRNTPLDCPIAAIRAKQPKRVPTGLTKDDTLNVIARLAGTPRFMVKRLYGGGLRLMEGLR
jgi:hypothetical protein